MGGPWHDVVLSGSIGWVAPETIRNSQPEKILRFSAERCVASAEVFRVSKKRTTCWSEKNGKFGRKSGIFGIPQLAIYTTYILPLMFVVLQVYHGIFLRKGHTDWQWENGEKRHTSGAAPELQVGSFSKTKNPMERMNDTLPETNSSPLKMMVSKFGISSSRGLFSGYMLVPGGVPVGSPENLSFPKNFWPLKKWLTVFWGPPNTPKRHRGSFTPSIGESLGSLRVFTYCWYVSTGKLSGFLIHQ